ncbi:MAG: cellulase family glycosylhydrolase [Acidimicrobiales bacterium]
MGSAGIAYRGRRVAGVLATCGALLVPLSAAAARAGAVPASLPWLHVAHPLGQRAELVDEAQRTVILRGANATGLEDDYYTDDSGHPAGTGPRWPIDPAAYEGRCPVNDHGIADPPLCEGDFAQMHSLGLDVVRLPVSWSLLEPTVGGGYSSLELDRIAQVVRWSAAQGIYVLIDMHQDNYSRFVGQDTPAQVPPLLTTTPNAGQHNDGAPPWAVIADPAPSVAPFGQAPFNARTEAAFTSFWLNRPASEEGVCRTTTSGRWTRWPVGSGPSRPSWDTS